MQGTALKPQTETKVGENLYKDEYGRLYQYLSGLKVYKTVNNTNFHVHGNKQNR